MYPGRVELHLHMDGALTEAFARECLKQQGIKEPEDLAAALAAQPLCENLVDYLKCFDIPLRILQYAETLERCAFDLVCRLAGQGYVYAELRFAPASHCAKGLTQQQAVEAVLRGIRAARVQYPEIGIGLLLCFMVGGDADHEATLNAARQYLGQGVVGVDMAGAEGMVPMEHYRPLFARAKAEGIPFTIHAGECGSWENILTALSFGARRIGHSTAAIRSPQCMERLRESGAALECCFTSNLQTRAVATPAEHPIRAFQQAGLRVTVNTDNPTVSATTLANEHRVLADQFGFSDEEFYRMDRTALEAAFVGEGERKALLARLETLWAEGQS
ncbi:adenosine deaminase [Allofournierella massiliensis]|uniref:adenosine deaminase n=1 Tax=Allofournierella massiliensis TaxID=1650663 RepID=UPI0024B1AA92|nr:adenosine deaminase [Fournierella massiliensis]